MVGIRRELASAMSIPRRSPWWFRSRSRLLPKPDTQSRRRSLRVVPRAPWERFFQAAPFKRGFSPKARWLGARRLGQMPRFLRRSRKGRVLAPRIAQAHSARLCPWIILVDIRHDNGHAARSQQASSGPAYAGPCTCDKSGANKAHFAGPDTWNSIRFPPGSRKKSWYFPGIPWGDQSIHSMPAP